MFKPNNNTLNALIKAYSWNEAVIMISKTLKEERVEHGKSKAYIVELEDKIKRLIIEKEGLVSSTRVRELHDEICRLKNLDGVSKAENLAIRRNVKREEIIKQLTNRNTKLSHSLKLAQDNNKQLITENLRLRGEIKPNTL